MVWLDILSYIYILVSIPKLSNLYQSSLANGISSLKWQMAKVFAWTPYRTRNWAGHTLIFWKLMTTTLLKKTNQTLPFQEYLRSKLNTSSQMTLCQLKSYVKQNKTSSFCNTCKFGIKQGKVNKVSVRNFPEF